MAERVEELKIWQRARELCRAIDAILGRPPFQEERTLREQIRAAADSIVANIAEGFHQPTDRAFANYLFIAKASNAETRKRLLRACERNWLSAEEFAERDAIADELARMITGLIKYLIRSNRRDRGLGPQGRKRRGRK